MRHHRKHLLFVAIFLATTTLLLTACGGDKKPPHYGAFMKDGKDLVELTEMKAFGVPNSSELEGVPIAPDSQPVIVLWNPDTRLQYLQLLSISSRQTLRYNANPKDEGIIELQSVDPLDPGRYCFIQGDPLGLELPAWCFEVE